MTDEIGIDPDVLDLVEDTPIGRVARPRGTTLAGLAETARRFGLHVTSRPSTRRDVYVGERTNAEIDELP